MENILFDAIKAGDANLTKYILTKHIHGEENLITAISNSISGANRYLGKAIWKFLNFDVDLEVCDKNNFTPFNWAVSINNRQIIDTFLAIPNLNVSQTGKTDGTDLFPLFYAAKNKNIEVMQALLDRNADINQRAYSGHTAFYFAYSCQYEYGENPLIDFFLSKPDLDVNITDNWSQTSALMHAALNHNVEVVEKLLKRPDIDVFLQSCFGDTALDIAKGIPDNEVVVQLINNHVNSIQS